MSHLVSLARESCIHDPVVILLLCLGNGIIAAVYGWIAVSIYRVAKALGRLPARPLWYLFPGFIGTCGLSHAAAVLVFFRPAWYLETAIIVATAIISAVTAALLHVGVPALRRLFLDAERLRAEIARDPD